MGHTLTEFVGLYLTKRRQALSWSARQATKYAFRSLIDVTLDVPICDITLADAEDWQEATAARKSKTTANSYLKSIRPCFNWAVRRKMIPANIFNELRPYRITEPEIRTFNNAEVRAILASSLNDLWRARIIAALSAGLRRTEVLNLCVQDIDFERGIINVKPKKQTLYTWPWEAKSYEIRQLPLVPELSRLLVSSIMPNLPAGQPYLMLTEKRYFDLKQRIENLPERLRLRPDEHWRPFRNLMNRADVEGTFHDLRRTCITNWSYHLPIQEVRKLAGHRDISTTLRYYCGIRPDTVNLATQSWASIGATGLEPATS